MAPTPRLSLDGVTATALSLIDTSGFDALSVSAVAQQLDVAPSALYTYCDGLDGLRQLVAVAATHNLATALSQAAIGHAGNAALDAMGGAYRQFALTNPGQFAATLRASAAQDDDLGQANANVLNVFMLVYAAMGMGESDSRLAARSTRSAIHGFLALEHSTGTTPSHDDEYRHMIDALHRGLVG